MSTSSSTTTTSSSTTTTSSSSTTTLSTSTTLTGTSTRRQRYDVALNGQGLILASKPETPKLLARQDDIFGQRFAAGDRDYNDLAKWWYMAQTDWSGGFKDVVSWLNDAKYYYSTNIDAYSEPGAIKLASSLVLEKDFTENIVCGSYEAVLATAYAYIGTDATGSTKPAIYRRTAANTWGNISSVFMPTTQYAVNDIMVHKGKLWFITSDLTTGGTYEIGYCDEDGGNPIDVSNNFTIAPRFVFCMDSDGATIYFGYMGEGGGQGAVISKSTDSGATSTTLVSLGNGARIPCLCIVGSSIYYLATRPNGVELRQYNGTADALIWFWPGANLGNSDYSVILGNQTVSSSISRKALLDKNGKLIITLKGEIWEWDYGSSVMTRIFDFSDTKSAIDEASRSFTLETNLLNLGPLIHDNKIWWHNLVYDDISFYNNKKPSNDSSGDYLNPVLTDGSTIYWVDTVDRTKIYKDSGLKGTANNNYIVFNNFDKISAVDKLAYSVDLIFKTLVSGDKIAIEYTTGELTSSTSWTVLGNANYNDDGAITQKTLYFGDSVLFKKIWFRVKLEGGGTTTTSLYDFVLAYLPMPDYRLRWDFTVKCEDEMQRKDQSKEPKNGVWLRNLLQKSWLTKSILTFEDFDADTYDSLASAHTATVTTITVNNNTDQFPEVGRLLIGTEEIFYTGKTKTTFTGCTRGVRGTNKVAHPINEAVTMGHRVIVRNYQEELIIANDPTKAEYLITIALSEV